jgi:hypothetical protein
MNTQELIDGIINLSYENYKYSPYVERKRVLELVRQLDEPQSIKLKDVIARIKSFDVGAKEVWLNEILNELGSDYGTLKYKAGYDQGKFDGAIEREKVTVPQFVADYIKDAKYYEWDLDDVFDHIAEESEESEIYKWFYTLGNVDVFARAWLDGYEVKKEKRYRVKMKNIHSYSSILKLDDIAGEYFFGSELKMCASSSAHTRKELEDAGFGEVFNSPLFEVEEVQNDSKI